jgi:uncharacterized protein YbaR (Trm112 family)
MAPKPTKIHTAPTDTYPSSPSVQVMTRVNALGGTGSVPEGPTLRQRRKGVLVCPRCSHESLVDGDWIYTVHEDHYNICCPDCRTRLTTRPLRE